MKLVMIKIIFEVLLVPNKRVFRIQMNYVSGWNTLRGGVGVYSVFGVGVH